MWTSFGLIGFYTYTDYGKEYMGLFFDDFKVMKGSQQTLLFSLQAFSFFVNI